MTHSLFAILPVFLLIVIGSVAKHKFIRDETFWTASDALVYYLFFPCLLILKIGGATFSGAQAGYGILTAVVATGLVAGMVYLYRILFALEDALFTSVFQGGVRYNSYVFIAVSEGLFGATGAALSGIFIANMIVFTNVLSVMVMNRYGSGTKKAWGSLFSKTLTNPLILGAFTGILVTMTGIEIIEPLRVLMAYLGAAATPLSLMSVGAGLVFVMERKKMLAVSYAVMAKLVFLPLFGLVFLKILGLSGPISSIALLYCTVPCAGNAYILSRQMGGDSQAMASMITWGTLLSVMTIPLFMFFSTELRF